jgi:zeaxanthin glucosyltransferase
MSRFLFVVAPLAGHANPAAAVAMALTRDGHDVAWVGSQTYFRPLAGEHATIYSTGLRPYRGQHDRGARAMKSVWEGFMIPFARAILPAVEKAVTTFEPDVLVVDQSALAGAVVGHRQGLRWATICPQAMEITRPFDNRPRVDAWIRAQLASLAPDIDPYQDDLRFSPHLVVAFTGTALTGPYPFPEHFALVGPAIGQRQQVPTFPWDRLDPHRALVLVTMGTLAQDIAADFYGRMQQALLPLGERVQAVMVAPEGTVPDPPDHVLVTTRAPILELLPMAAAVVGHAGLNTTCESLAYGVPLVLAPIRHDQPIIAAQAVDAGAAVRVSFTRATPDQLRIAITRLLDDPAYRQAAGRIRNSFTAAGGAQAAANQLAGLAARSLTRS